MESSPIAIQVYCGISQYGHNQANGRPLVAVDAQET